MIQKHPDNSLSSNKQTLAGVPMGLIMLQYNAQRCPRYIKVKPRVIL